MVAGTKNARTIVASTMTATARPTPPARAVSEVAEHTRTRFPYSVIPVNTMTRSSVKSVIA